MASAIQLPKENLYADGFIVDLGSDIKILKRNKFNYLGKNTNDRVHTVIEDETIWAISGKYYGNSKWWHVITDANNVENPMELVAGISLIIPDLSTVIAAR